MDTITRPPIVGATIVGITQEAAYLFLKDFDATPDEVMTGKTNEVGRSPLDQTVELVGFCQMVVKVLAGEKVEMGHEAVRAALHEQFGTREAARAGFEAGIQAICEAVASYTEEDWGTTITAPWGMDITKAHLVGWVGLHTMYHDGQINFIQTLHGDCEMHWM